MKITKSYLKKLIAEESAAANEASLKQPKISPYQNRARIAGKHFLKGRSLLGSMHYINAAVKEALEGFNVYNSTGTGGQGKMLNEIYEIMDEYYESAQHAGFKHWQTITQERFESAPRKMMRTFNVVPNPDSHDLKPFEYAAGAIPRSAMQQSLKSIIEIVGRAISYFETDALRRDSDYQESLKESKKSKNKTILENHRKGREVHPVARSNWWYDA